MKEINSKVLIQDRDQFIAPTMEELDYENELSELALEYVDEIVSEYGPYLNKKRKRVST